jgi:hypothetical protein
MSISRLAIDRRLFVTVAAIAGPATSLFAAARATSPGDPLSFISAVYKRTVKEGGGNFVYGEAANRSRYLTKSLVELWAKADAATPEGDEGPGGFDFLTDTNGMTIASFRAAPEKRDATSARIAVTLGYKEKDALHKGPPVLHCDLLIEDGAWKIDDIHAKEWELRKLLTDFIAVSK